MRVLLFAFLLEGGSTCAAFKEFRAAKGSLGWIEAVLNSKDPPAFIVLLENGAAMAGIVAAAIGVALSQITGNPFFDGAASVVIGLILGFTAWVLAVESKALLIGESADQELIESIRAAAAGQPGVVGIGHVLTVHSSPDQIMVVMSADFEDEHHRRRGREDRRRRRGAKSLRDGRTSSGSISGRSTTPDGDPPTRDRLWTPRAYLPRFPDS